MGGVAVEGSTVTKLNYSTAPQLLVYLKECRYIYIETLIHVSLLVHACENSVTLYLIDLTTSTLKIVQYFGIELFRALREYVCLSPSLELGLGGGLRVGFQSSL
jgi:hypothetical protein